MNQKVYTSLSFDVDGETLWTSKDSANWERPVTLSQGKFGLKVGLQRILKLLEKYGIKATFFVPAWVIENYEEYILQIYENGHEIGHHGYLHEYPDTIDSYKEKEVLSHGIETIKGLTGKIPAGYRSPAWEFSKHTLKYLKQFGFSYSSNMMDNDEPYIHENGIVELPVHWSLDDAPFFVFSPRMPGRVMQPTRTIFEMWESEYSALYNENKPFILTLHPQLIGRAHRIQQLEKLIQFILKHKKAEFITLEALALKRK